MPDTFDSVNEKYGPFTKIESIYDISDALANKTLWTLYAYEDGLDMFENGYKVVNVIDYYKGTKPWEASDFINTIWPSESED